jgi:hypothetical protein
LTFPLDKVFFNLSRGNARVTSISDLAALSYLEIVLCIAVLCILIARKQWVDYSSLGWFLALHSASTSVLLYLHYASRAAYSQGHLAESHLYYVWYFPIYWISFAMESVLSLIVVYGVFRLAMAPLKGLQALGMLVFKWAAGISVAVAVSGAFSPDLSGKDYLIHAIQQLQRTQSILVLCLLLFVCFAIRPMGLSYSSRIFGVSLGLGVMATTELVQSAWLTVNPGMKSVFNLVNGVVICTVIATWGAYFAIPEPKRRLIVLPTTSPFLRWNQISQALGDNPGFVAIGGVPSELFAPAELEVMRRASQKMVTEFPHPRARAEDHVIEGFSRAV